MTPRRCSARSKRTHEQCGQHVVGGATVCRWHGGESPQARQKAAERQTWAEAVAQHPRRSPAEILADVVHQQDYAWHLAQASVAAGEATPELREMQEMAGRWAKLGIDAGVQERQTRVQEATVQLLFVALQRVFDRLDLTPAQRALVPTVVPEELQRVELEAGGLS